MLRVCTAARAFSAWCGEGGVPSDGGAAPSPATAAADAMSRWGRGRGGGVTVPLDNLFRENSNCPSAARSAGTVGKWGITSFTSIRTAPYCKYDDVCMSPASVPSPPPPPPTRRMTANVLSIFRESSAFCLQRGRRFRGSLL